MQLKITIDGKTKALDVPTTVLDDGEAFFRKMDGDMDKGWQMGPEFIENPDQLNRCQIAADKILVAVDTRNNKLLLLMAGYILSRLPGVSEVIIDNNGDMLSTQLIMGDGKPLH